MPQEEEILNFDMEKIELEVRRRIASEISDHKEFLNKQLRITTASIVGVLSVAALVGAYFFGESYSDLEKKVVREVDRKVIEYKLIDKYDRQLEKRIELHLDGEIVDKKMNALVGAAVQKEFRRIESEDLGSLVDRAVDETMLKWRRDLCLAVGGSFDHAAGICYAQGRKFFSE